MPNISCCKQNIPRLPAGAAQEERKGANKKAGLLGEEPGFGGPLLEGESDYLNGAYSAPESPK